MTAQERLTLEFLTARGAASSADIRASLRVSQPTMSRILSALSDEFVTLGAGKRTLYAVAQPIGIHPSQQPIWMVGQVDYAPFDVDLSFASESIRVAAADFWHAVTQGEQFSQGFKKLAATMVAQFR